MIAKNIIEDDESAVVFLTKEDGWKTFDGGFAITGEWLIKKDFAVHKAIIYKHNSAEDCFDVFVGVPLDVFPAKQDKRFSVRLMDVSFVGSTDNDWCAFTESKKGAINPVKYINKNKSKTNHNSLLNI